MPNERLLQKKGQTDRQTDGRTDRRHKPRDVAATRRDTSPSCLMSVYFRKKDRQTDRQTDRRHKPRVEVSLNGIQTTGLREEVSRLVAATCQKNWVGYALRKRATKACLMSVYFRKKDGQTDGQTDRRHIPRVEVSLDGIPT